MEQLLQLLQQYQANNQMGGMGNLNIHPVSGLQHFRMNPTRGYLAQQGGLIQEPVSYQPQFNVVTRLPDSGQEFFNRRSFIASQLENPRSDKRLKTVKTKGLTGVQLEDANTWNEFINTSGLKGKKLTDDLRERILDGDRSIPGMDILGFQQGGTVVVPGGTGFNTLVSPASPTSLAIRDSFTQSTGQVDPATYRALSDYWQYTSDPIRQGTFELDTEPKDDPELERRRKAWNSKLKELNMVGEPRGPSLDQWLTMRRSFLDSGRTINPITGNELAYGGYGDVEKAFLGKLIRGIGRGIGAVSDFVGEGIKGIADFGLGLVGAPNVINNSFVDRSGFISGLNNTLGTIGRTALSVVNPALGAGVSLLGGGLNRLAGGQGGNQALPLAAAGASGLYGAMGGGGLGFGNFPNVQLANPFQASFGQDIFGRQPLAFSNGGIVPFIPEGYQGIQTELYRKNPERLIFPDGKIVRVNATTSHERMDDDDITDIVPVGTYVASARPDMRINRSDLERFVIGVKNMPYEEGQKAGIPEEITAAGLLKKKERKILPTEYARRIEKTFKTVDRDVEDIFNLATNQQNVQNRTPYFQALVTLGEKARINKQENAMLSAEMDVTELEHGGLVQRMGYSDGSPFGDRDFIDIYGDTIDMRHTGRALQLKANNGMQITAQPYSGVYKFPGATSVREVPVFQGGGWVQTVGDIAGILGTAAPFIGSLFGNNNNAAAGQLGYVDPLSRSMILGSFPLSTLGTIQNVRAQQGALGNALTNLTGLNNDLLSLNNQGTAAGIAGQLAQQTDLPELNYDFSRLQTFNTRTPQSFINAAATPLNSASAVIDRLGNRGAASFLANDAAQRMAARNSVAAQQFNQDRNLDYSIANTITAGQNQEAQLNNAIQQQEIAARNNVFSNIASQAQNNLANRGNILSDTFRVGSDLELQLAQLSGQIPSTIAQNMLNVGSINQMLNAQNQLVAPQQAAGQAGAPYSADAYSGLLDVGQAIGQLGSQLGSPGLTDIVPDNFIGTAGAYDPSRLAGYAFDGQTSPGAGLFLPQPGQQIPSNILSGISTPTIGNTGFGGATNIFGLPGQFGTGATGVFSAPGTGVGNILGGLGGLGGGATGAFPGPMGSIPGWGNIFIPG